MTEDEAHYFKGYLAGLADAATDGRIEWIAISVKRANGNREAIHSKDAPDRPQGIT